MFDGFASEQCRWRVCALLLLLMTTVDKHNAVTCVWPVGGDTASCSHVNIHRNFTEVFFAVVRDLRIVVYRHSIGHTREQRCSTEVAVGRRSGKEWRLLLLLLVDEEQKEE
jgi:hypothetical protein